MMAANHVPSHTTVRNFSQQVLYFCLRRSYYICISQKYTDYVFSIGPQIVTLVTTSQSVSSSSDWICGHAIMIIRGTRRIYNLQLLVQFPSLFNNRHEIQNNSLYVRTSVFSPFFIVQLSNTVNCIQHNVLGAVVLTTEVHLKGQRANT